MAQKLSNSQWEAIKREIISRANDLFGPRLVMWLTHLFDLAKTGPDAPSLVVTGNDNLTGGAPPEVKQAVIELITNAIGKINKPIVRLILTAFVTNALPRILDSFWDNLFSGGPLVGSGMDLKAANLTELVDLKECDSVLPEKVG